jgi:Winged helix DNA-binding domain
VPRILSRRELGRATLARQRLLGRVRRPVRDTLEHLVGLQGQVPKVPHLALWARLANYDPAELDGLMSDRDVVRTPLMRTTIHTVTTADARVLRPVLQPVLDRVFSGTAWGQRLRGQDVSAAVDTSVGLLAQRPMTRSALTRELAARHPDVDAEAVAFGVGYWVPWVQPPPRGLWGASGAPVLTPLDTWAGADDPAEPIPLDRLVARYLGAFGPASVRDVQAWCGLTRLREVTDSMELVRYRSEDGVELLDVPGAALADPDAPAPVRFLAEYDNVTLSHADRSRVIGDAPLQPLQGGPGGWVGSVLVDGLVSAMWAARTTGDGTVLEVRVARALTGPERAELELEGRALLAFLAPGRGHDVRFTDP